MLGDFVEKTFVEELENGAVKAALLQWLKLLTLIDHVRSFGLLNAVAVRTRILVIQTACKYCGF